MNLKLVIFDFNRTLYDRVSKVEMEGASEVIKRINELNIPICIISRNEGSESEQLVISQSFFPYVDEVYYVDGDSKKEKYLEVISDFNVSSSEVLVVGDYLLKDIKPAIELGCITVWFKHGKFGVETPLITGINPKYIIESLHELFQFIEKV